MATNFQKRDTILHDNLHFKIVREKCASSENFYRNEFYEIMLVLSGKIVYNINGVEHLCDKGSVSFVTPLDIHKKHVEAPAYVIRVCFCDDMLGDGIFDFLRSPQVNNVVCPNGKQFKRFYDELLILLDEYAEKKLFWKYSAHIGVSRLTTEIIALLPNMQVTGKEQPKDMNDVLYYIRHNFNGSISKEFLAGSLFISVSYFEKRFKAAFGFSFYAYIQEMRLDYAMSLLKNPNLGISETAFKCGAKSLSSFERAFKKRFGKAPSVLKKAYNS